MQPPFAIEGQTITADRPEAGALVRLLNVVLRRRRLLVVWAFIGVALSGVWVLVHPRTYTSSAAIVPQSSGSNRSQLSGLAAQFGLSAGSGVGEDAPGYYPELVQSRSILRSVLDTVVALRQGSDTRTAPLWSWLHPKGDNVPQRIESAVDILSRHLQVARDKDSGIIRFSVTYPDSTIPLLVSRRILKVLSDFNLHTRQTQASAERTFVELRLADAREELRRAENALQLFLQTNREYKNSPQLFFQQDRLQRDVTTRQGVVTSLTQSYEQARIDEVRNTPVFTTLEEPLRPVRPDPRGLLLKLLAGLVLGTVAGAAIAVAGEFVRRVRVADPAAYAELSDHLRIMGSRTR